MTKQINDDPKKTLKYDQAVVNIYKKYVGKK
jgi:hypothetical protein